MKTKDKDESNLERRKDEKKMSEKQKRSKVTIKNNYKTQQEEQTETEVRKVTHITIEKWRIEKVE